MVSWFDTLLFLLIFNLFYHVEPIDSCDNWQDLNSSTPFSNFQIIPEKKCYNFPFHGFERINSHLGSVRLSGSYDSTGKKFQLNVSFNKIKWQRAYLKLYAIGHENHHICKSYSIKEPTSLKAMTSDTCFDSMQFNTSVNYRLEFKAQLDIEEMYRIFVFKVPSMENFNQLTPLAKQSLFISIDVSTTYSLIVNIHPLLIASNDIKTYKIEVFKEKNHNNILMDVRMVKSQHYGEADFEYFTYNEEGFYFFKISVINDECPEDACLKTMSPKIYIKRKYPPLVIGIVGASFMIPFFLFIFHMFTRKTQQNGEDFNEQQRNKIFIVANQTPEKHYNIVKAFEKSLKSLANVQIINNITQATHILYISGTYVFESDLTTHKFLVTETNKIVPSVEIYVISFPHSIKDIPPFLKKCLRFEMMTDYVQLMEILNCDLDYKDDSSYNHLKNMIEMTNIETEPKKIILNVPRIIVTEHSDSNSDIIEAKEADGLL